MMNKYELKIKDNEIICKNKMTGYIQVVRLRVWNQHTLNAWCVTIAIQII